ncbi:unnamed protein product, partial [Chrysoparadoxa australica]
MAAAVTFMKAAEFTDNTTGLKGGAVFSGSFSTVTFENTALFTENTSGAGGAIFVQGGEVTCNASATFTGNLVDSGGRGAAALVQPEGGTSVGTMNVAGLLTLSGNTCGGITCDAMSSQGEILISGGGSSFNYCTSDPDPVGIVFFQENGGVENQSSDDSVECVCQTDFTAASVTNEDDGTLCVVDDDLSGICLYGSCMPLGACCAADATCALITGLQCATGGGQFQGVGSECLVTAGVSGACRATGNKCTLETRAQCNTNGGIFMGDGSECFAGFDTNSANITANSAAIATNSAGIAENSANITTNSAAIAANLAGIAENSANITTNSAAIATNSAGIAENFEKIVIHHAAIAENSANITTNSAGIATNLAGV